MWTLAVFGLSLIIATSAIDAGSRNLEKPTNLRVWERNDSRVTLAWDFSSPEEASLESVEFSLHVLSDGVRPRKFFPRFDSEPYKYEIKDLSPMTEYTVKLLAIFPDSRESEAVQISFTTLPSDLPAPVIKSAVGRRLNNFVEYFVAYELQKPPVPVVRFQIHVCDNHCSEYLRNGTEFTARVAVEFQSTFSITVIACYDGGAAGFVKREGKPFLGATGMAIPANALKFAAEKKGNRIMLAWHPPHHPRGPTSYYDIIVCDPTRENIHRWDNEPPRSAKGSSLLTSGVYEMIFETEGSGLEHFKPSIAGGCPSPDPVTLVVVDRTQSWARYRIVFAKPSMYSFDELDESTHMRRLYLRTSAAATFNLSPFSRIHYKVRSCVAHEDKPVDTCGKFVNFELKSDVEAPSEVLYAEMFPWGDKLTVSWQQPENPRGPIDGYMLSINEEGEDVTESEEAIVRPSREPDKKLFYIVDNFSASKTYNIGIAAFNFDLEDSTKLHVGEWIYLTTYSSGVSHFGQATLILILSCLSLLTITLCLLRCWAKKQPVREEADIPMEAWEGPSEDEVEE